MVRKGDKVIMNGKYYVSEKNKDKEFIVTTEPAEVCGCLLYTSPSPRDS